MNIKEKLNKIKRMIFENEVTFVEVKDLDGKIYKIADELKTGNKIYEVVDGVSEEIKEDIIIDLEDGSKLVIEDSLIKEIIDNSDDSTQNEDSEKDKDVEGVKADTEEIKEVVETIEEVVKDVLEVVEEVNKEVEELKVENSRLKDDLRKLSKSASDKETDTKNYSFNKDSIKTTEDKLRFFGKR